MIYSILLVQDLKLLKLLVWLIVKITTKLLSIPVPIPAVERVYVYPL